MINSAFSFYDNKRSMKNIVENCAKNYSEKQIIAAATPEDVIAATKYKDTLKEIKTACDVCLCLPEFIGKVQDQQKINALEKSHQRF